ncbi:MAG: hypothetical protein JW821_16130 [Deltaproteobacteria bacterium]|nr:hypothetical protein [Deltaproteobacteria bacterium]
MRKRVGRSPWRVIFFAVLWVLSAQAFGHSGFALAQSAPGVPTLQVRKIAFLPFFKGVQSSNIQETLACPLCRLYLEPEGVAPGGEFVLTDYVQEALVLKHEDRVFPARLVKSTLEGISGDKKEDTPLSLAQKTGKALGTDLVMVGFIWRFRDRVGGAAGVESPASVAFALHLLSVETGRVIWNAGFNETQQSLSENILDARTFLKRGGRWLTAPELARYGVEEVFERYPFR